MSLFPRRISLAVVAAVAVFVSPAFAGTETGESYKQATVQQSGTQGNTENMIYLDSTYDFGADFHKGKGAFGKQDAVNTTVQIGHRFPIPGLDWPNEGGQWFFRAGAFYERYDFSRSKAPTPDVLQSFSADLALEYMVQGNQALFIETYPGFYFSNRVTASAFDIPTDIGAGFKIYKDKVYGFIGAEASMLRSSSPVLPLGGILWHVTPKLDLRAIVPKPRVVYNVNDDLAFFAGGELTGGSFKTNGDNNLDPKRLSGAVVNYAEYRGGAGVTYQVKALTLEAAGGWTFSRDFDYPRADLNYSTKGAPYARLSVHFDF